MSSPSRLLKGRTTAPLPSQYAGSSPQLHTDSTFSCPSLESEQSPAPLSAARSSTHGRLNDVIMKVVRLALDKNSSQEDFFRLIESAVRDLVNADRASLFLPDHTGQELYAHVFSVSKEESTHVNTVTLEHTPSCFKNYISNLGRKAVDVVSYRGKQVSLPIDKGIIGYVARTGKLINVTNTEENEHFCCEFDQLTGYRSKTILCAPLVVNGKVNGALEAVNKKGGVFSKMDEHLLQSVALICGLYLHNSHLQKECKILENKCQVTNEMLVYHRQCSERHFQQIKSMARPSVGQYDIGNFSLDTASIHDDVKVHLVVTMISDLVGETLFDSEHLLRFSLTVSKNYRHKPYHNWDHAFHVAQCMYCIIKGSLQHFDEIERFALVLACLCHDLDHRGFNNTFLVATKHPLSQLYSSSILENHHFSQTVELLLIDGLNVYSLLSEKQYQNVIEVMRKAILATDLVNFFKNKGELSEIIHGGTFNWENTRHKDLTICLMMTACDLCCACKPWEVHAKSVEAIFEEFYTQGDVEKARGVAPIQMMDRDYKHQLSSFQIGFIESITEPCCELLKTVLPHLGVLLEATKNNKIKWEAAMTAT